jgi:hypothetical protein
MKHSLVAVCAFISVFACQFASAAPDLTFTDSDDNTGSRYVLSNFSGWDANRNAFYAFLQSDLNIDWPGRKINSETLFSWMDIADIPITQSVQDTCEQVFDWTLDGIAQASVGLDESLSDRFTDPAYIQKFPDAYRYSLADVAWFHGEIRELSSGFVLSCIGNL